VDKALKEARANPDRVVLLYEDEASLYRQPSQASLFCLRGKLQPKMPCSCSANTVMRVAGFLNACSGAVHFWDGSKITAGKIAKCLKEISITYAHSEKIYIVMDNWPVHFHPKVMKVIAENPKLQILRLPTYAPWLNPIEKLWRLTKQSVVHAHGMSNDFNKFKQVVRSFLTKPTTHPEALLRYVGLFS
jgi:hypothetical protein